jgi:hypothetical protein
MNRRTWLIRSAGALAAISYHRSRGISMRLPSDPPTRSALAAFDHILLGASDLAAGIDWVQQHTGVRAQAGGSHPGLGTRNALLSLGTDHYLEIIAPDPEQPNVHDEFGLEKLTSPRIVQWAVHAENIVALRRHAEQAGIRTIGPEAGSRRRPDGTTLHWQTLGIEAPTPLVPFFIEWGRGSAHPSASAPLLGQPKSLRFETPQPQELRRILLEIGIEADIRTSATARIVLRVQTARGEIEIS